MSENTSKEVKKAHRPTQSGVKSVKKKFKNKAADASDLKNRNPKAFAINSALSGERKFRRKEDIIAKAQHIPVVDPTTDEPPPVLVAVVGPPKVGKTTLIKNIIKNFTHFNIASTDGPITIVISKKKRLTLIECNNDINSMIDIAKCADIVLLLMDASYGLEMEIFEFLNICQVHGMPKIMGVLTHLDLIQNPKQMRKRKKELKHRFWTEVYNGAKLFYLSCLTHGQYLKNEIKNLVRFISVIKLRPLQWRSSHSYVLADRFEDVTNTDLVRRNSKCDRDIVLYGYVRGVPIKQEHMVHIAGLGDVHMEDLGVIDDPCPLPNKNNKKRSFLEKDRLLYAPLAGVGGIVYDSDALYIELGGSHNAKEADDDGTAKEKHKLVESLFEKKKTVDELMEEQEFKLFSDGTAIKSKDFISATYENQDSLDGLLNNENSEKDSAKGDSDTDATNMDTDEDDECNTDDAGEDDEDENDSMSDDASSQESSSSELNINEFNWKDKLHQKHQETRLQHSSQSKSLRQRIYGCYNQSSKEKIENKSDEESSNEQDEIGGLFKQIAKNQSDLVREKGAYDVDECCLFNNSKEGDLRDWVAEQQKDSIKDCFVSGKWKQSEDAETLLKLDDASGDFEDLTKSEENDEDKSQEGQMDGVEQSDVDLLRKKIQLKSKFDTDYDETTKSGNIFRIEGEHDFYKALKKDVQLQSELNRSEFSNLDATSRLMIEGFRAGLYVRMRFKNVPAELVQHFDASYPILIGSLNMSEENIGYVHCKVKKHRWYKKTLKTGDPLILSMGWRRFQTVPIYAKVEDNFRHRYLKYTPNHIACYMTFYGPITAQTTGFLALQRLSTTTPDKSPIGFRIAATGCVVEVNKSTQIMKKLKLVGQPFKIFKKSAFIKDMFNSSVEVAKFEGAKIKTVSGIRGQIKKVHLNPQGSFRATFEDKILLSDIVFCRTWCRVDVPQFYTPVSSLLYAPEMRTCWQGMRTMGELKRERNIRNECNEDSLYTDIKRQPAPFKPLAIPKALEQALPYKDKAKLQLLSSSGSSQTASTKVHSAQSQKIESIMKKIETNYKRKRALERDQTKKRLKNFRKEIQMKEMQKLQRQKQIRSKISRIKSKKSKSTQ